MSTPGKYVKPPWLSLDPEFVNGPDARSPQALEQACQQFDVEHNPRYRPQAGKTFCNIFIWDVTRALSCEIPHWVTSEGEPAPVGKGKELRANDMHGWFLGAGRRHGWEPCVRRETQMHAEAGQPVVALWVNPMGGPGHVALVLDAAFNIAQAGTRNFVGQSLLYGFGPVGTVHFFYHS